MSVNKPLPATPDMAPDELYGMRAARPSTACNRRQQQQHIDDDISKRLSVALFANKSALMYTQSSQQQISEDKPRGRAAIDCSKPPGDNETNVQRPPPRHPPVALSYYNSRLNPIQKKEVQPTSYHGVYQGVPLVDEVTPTAWKPWEVDQADEESCNHVASGAAQEFDSISYLPRCSQTPPITLTPVSTSTLTTAIATPAIAVEEGDREAAAKQHASLGRAQSSAGGHKQERNSMLNAHGLHRPLSSSTQKTHGRPHTEWRDIHVQSLSRVDSILREAVGLQALDSARWSAQAPVSHGLETPATLSANGLGISISQSASLPSGLESDGHQGMYSLLAFNASTSAFGGQSHLGHAAARPSIAYSQLMTPMSTSTHVDGYWQAEAGITTPSPGAGAGTGMDMGTALGTTRLTRLLTASSLDRAHANARIASMSIGHQTPRPATAHGQWRQMSMYNPSNRQVQLSRDEFRRSRLFAEYERLVLGKGSGDEHEEGEEDEGDDSEDNLAGQINSNVDMSIDEAEAEDDAVLVGVPIECAHSSLDDISEEAEYEFANYEPSPEEEVSIGSPCSDEDALSVQQTSLSDKRKPIYAARPRPATVFCSGAREMRDTQAHSMYSTADMACRRQTEKRWTRILVQNQHLFRAPVVSDQLDHESVFGESGGGDETAGENGASGPAPLQLDLSPAADLFTDVTSALAECLPPLSARSVGSRQSATTTAVRREHAVSVAFPLSGSQFLSLQADAAFGMASFSDMSMGRRAGSNSGGSDSTAATARRGDARGDVAGDRSAKRESIYINSTDFFDSALLGEGELPYQQENEARGENASESGASEYTPTIGEDYVLGGERLHISVDFGTVAELDIGVGASMDGATGPLGAIAAGSGGGRHGGGSGGGRHGHGGTQSAPHTAENGGEAEDGSEAHARLGPRNSEVIRQRLQYVEGRTPAKKLGTELSKSDDEHRQLLDAYMRRFDFHDQPVDFALRQLFQELHLPAESQQIDRVLASFSERYHTCNGGLFFSADVVYSYAFAILLLHTDAHNPKVRHKITKAQFVARAKLLDEHGAGRGNEMFDEVLEILYDNVTMVKFEYAPSSALGGQPLAGVMAQRPATSQGIGSRQQHSPFVAASMVGDHARMAGDHARDPAAGISGWFRRVFAPASTPGGLSKSPASPQDVPSKEQYSYSTLPRRRVARAAEDREAGDAEQAEHLRQRSNTAAPSINVPQISPLAADFALISHGGVDAFFAAPSDVPSSSPALVSHGGVDAFFTAPSDVSGSDGLRAGAAARPFKSSPLAVGTAHISSSIERDGSLAGAPLPMSTGFATSDIAAPPQPLAVETIRLSSVKSHVRRRVSLREGRPLSGIIHAAPAPAAGAAPSSALLRVDMAGRVSRKMERLGNGRRGLVRRWKDVWMVLSGSRLFFFRPAAAAAAAPLQQPAMSIQAIVPLRDGVAVVDAAYKKYPHVFRILAGDGSQVLIKAPADDAVAEWMARINCAAAFKTTGIERRAALSSAPPAPPPAPADSARRARLLEESLASLDENLNAIDDNLERSLRLFKQLAAMVPLTRHARTKAMHYVAAVRDRLKLLYLSEQRLTCYKDVLELDLAIECELARHRLLHA